LVSQIEGSEHTLRVFKNSLLRKVYVLKEEEVTGCWRKLHNEELGDLCRSSNIIGVFKLRRIGRVWLVACVGEGRLACRVLVEKGTTLRVGG
jgi:hypothetical protein